MTIDETKQLGIEFERRIQTLIPTTEFARKLDTQTIYSFLNQYQDMYVDALYKGMDGIQSGSNVSANVEKILQPLISTEEIPASAAVSRRLRVSGRSLFFKLPENFGKYLRSLSNVSSEYRYKNYSGDSSIKMIPNKLSSETEIYKFIETPIDSLRILRNPIALLTTDISDQQWEFGQDFPIAFCSNNRGDEVDAQPYNAILVIHDRYTKITHITLVYYRLPKHFSILTNTACELPMDAFNDIVTGAVDLYIRHATGSLQQEEPKEKEDKK